MKTIGYLIFAGFYYIFRFFCRIKKKKVFCVMTHDAGRDGNVAVMAEYLKQRNEGYTFAYLKKTERNRARDMSAGAAVLAFFLAKPYHLATSELVLLDNIFLPMAYLRFNRRVRIIQLWHGTGTIKKFGQDVNRGHLKKLEKKANSRVTHLIVNSEYTRKRYAKIFGINEEKVFVCGLPRTDLFFDENKREDRLREFYKKYPGLVGKKLILYAPTFRDREVQSPRLALDTGIWCEEMPGDCVLLLRVHPYVADAFEEKQLHKSDRLNTGKIRSMSSYPDISTVLLAADCVITDYSSVIFEYCILRRPMFFYAYDLEEFSDQGRGFYENYETYVPGPVVRNTEALIALLKEDRFEKEKTEAFIKESYKYFDGKSAERIYLHIISGGSGNGRTEY